MRPEPDVAGYRVERSTGSGGGPRHGRPVHARGSSTVGSRRRPTTSASSPCGPTGSDAGRPRWRRAPTPAADLETLSATTPWARHELRRRRPRPRPPEARARRRPPVRATGTGSADLRLRDDERVGDAAPARARRPARHRRRVHGPAAGTTTGTAAATAGPDPGTGPPRDAERPLPRDDPDAGRATTERRRRRLRRGTRPCHPGPARTSTTTARARGTPDSLDYGEAPVVAGPREARGASVDSGGSAGHELGTVSVLSERLLVPGRILDRSQAGSCSSRSVCTCAGG